MAAERADFGAKSYNRLATPAKRIISADHRAAVYLTLETDRREGCGRHELALK